MGRGGRVPNLDFLVYSATGERGEDLNLGAISGLKETMNQVDAERWGLPISTNSTTTFTRRYSNWADGFRYLAGPFFFRAVFNLVSPANRRGSP